MRTLFVFVLGAFAAYQFFQWQDRQGAISRDGAEPQPGLLADAEAATRPRQVEASVKIERTEKHITTAVSSMARIGAGGAVGGVTIIHLGTDEPRLFKVRINQVHPGNAAIASGSFEEEGQRKEAGEIFVHELPPNLIDGAEWTGWLERSGTQTLQTPWGEYRTLPTYRAIAQPANLPPSKAAATPRGAWMWDEQHRSRRSGER